MRQRARKFVGAIVMVLAMTVYAILATAIYINLLAGFDWWVLIIYFAVAGLGWFVPAAWIVRWMTRPDA